MRIAIAGGPKTGKTTLARDMSELGLPTVHTDDYIALGWSEASAAAASLFNAPGPLLMEGVAVPRALRKWMRAHPEGKPVDQVIYLQTAHTDVSEGQRRMAAGVLTVFMEIEGELRERGVEILYR